MSGIYVGLWWKFFLVIEYSSFMKPQKGAPILTLYVSNSALHFPCVKYLISGKHVEPIFEERRLAILCLRYLTFDIFDPDIAESDLEEHLMDGSFAFQNCAALHWLGHPHTIVQFVTNCKIDQLQDLASAIDAFHDTYGSGDIMEGDSSQEFVEQLQKLQGTGLSENSLLLLAHARKTRAGDEKLTGLGDLSKILERTRHMLEMLSQSPNLATKTKENLQQYYGENWFKCSYHKCFYFHDGFKTLADLQCHLNRHKRPYCRTELSCPRTDFGFLTEKELKKHMATQHPDPAVFAWRFPKIKTEPVKHPCTVCHKEFTRAHSLLVHMRTHTKEKPWDCDFCKSAFARKSDLHRHRKRHVSTPQSKGESSDLGDISTGAITEASDSPRTQEDPKGSGKSEANAGSINDGGERSSQETAGL